MWVDDHYNQSKRPRPTDVSLQAYATKASETSLETRIREMHEQRSNPVTSVDLCSAANEDYLLRLDAERAVYIANEAQPGSLQPEQLHGQVEPVGVPGFLCQKFHRRPEHHQFLYNG